MTEQKTIFSTQYFGGPVMFASAMQQSNLFLEAYENYQKRSLRNRSYLLGPNGIQVLSVPLKKGKNKQTNIKDVKISHDSYWQILHLETIKSCYNRSPYLEYYLDEIKEILNKNHSFLWDLNLDTINWVLNKIDLKIELQFSEKYSKQYQSDLRHSESDYFKSIESGLSAKMHYAQVFEDKYGFRYCRSILDLLFCTGPETKVHLL